MQKRSRFAAVLCLCVALSSVTIAWGQTALATITGTITDASGAVLANAPINVRNLENGQIYTSASSETGNYTVPQLPIGDYELTVTVSGFRTYTHQLPPGSGADDARRHRTPGRSDHGIRHRYG